MFKQLAPHIVRLSDSLTAEQIRLLSKIFHRLRFQDQLLFSALGKRLVNLTKTSRPYSVAILAYLKCCSKMHVCGNEADQIFLAKSVRVFAHDVICVSFLLQFYCKLGEEEGEEFGRLLRDCHRGILLADAKRRVLLLDGGGGVAGGAPKPPASLNDRLIDQARQNTHIKPNLNTVVLGQLMFYVSHRQKTIPGLLGLFVCSSTSKQIAPTVE